MKKLRLEPDKRIKRPLGKLKDNKGETLIEVLVSILIISISIALLAMTIGSSGNIIDKSRNNLTDYYNENNEIEVQQGTGSKQGTVTLSFEDDSSSAITKEVYYYKNEKASKYNVSSFKLVPMSDGNIGD